MTRVRFSNRSMLRCEQGAFVALGLLLSVHSEAQQDAAPPQPASSSFVRRQAEIAKEVDDYNAIPHKAELTSASKNQAYAIYYSQAKSRIEKTGTENFPRKNGRKLYGKLVLSIPIFQDGTLYMKGGGPRVVSSSGNKDLDRAALAIVQRSAPFEAIPQNMHRDTGEVWEITYTFNFMHLGDEVLAVE